MGWSSLYNTSLGVFGYSYPQKKVILWDYDQLIAIAAWTSRHTLD